MAWFSKCVTWLCLQLALAGLLAVEFFEKKMAYQQWLCSHLCDHESCIGFFFFCHDTCLRFMACPGCSRQRDFFWRAGVPLPFACIWDNIKCTSRNTWHHLPHSYGIWTTICSCLRLLELPGAEEVGALQSQAAPCSGEQQGYFSSARFPLPPWAGDGTRCGRCDASTLVKYLNFIY